MSDESKDLSRSEAGFFEEPPDPELAALPPPPPRRRRNPWFMAIVLVLGALVLWWYRFEIAFFFAPSEPKQLGDAMEIDTSRLESNTFVSLEAWPNPTRVVKFSRRVKKGNYRLFAVVGQKKIFVQTFLPEGSGERPSASEMTGSYVGRLISFRDLGSTFLTRSGYDGIRRFFREKLFVEIGDDCWLLMDGVHPRSYWGYLVMAGVVLLVVLVNAVLLARRTAEWLRYRRA